MHLEGKGISVDFDGRKIVIQPKNAAVEDALGASRLALNIDTISSGSLHPAGFLSDGWLDIVTKDHRRYQLRFLRKHQPAFKELYESVLATRNNTLFGPIDGSRTAGSPVGLEPTVRGRGYCGQQVAGESHYFSALRTLSGRSRTGEREVIAILRREPGNRYDGNAIQVTIDGHVVGYLPREDAEAYQVPLRMLEDQGRAAICRARLWWSRERDTFIASVSLDLAEPPGLVPINGLDFGTRHLLVPAGRTYQVTRESEHMDVLVPLIGRAYLPGKVAYYGTLHSVERKGPRSTSRVVTVHIDGREIGELSKQSSTKLMPLLQTMAAARITCYAEVVLTGNALAVEAKLYITPPEDLAPTFLARLEQMVNH